MRRRFTLAIFLVVTLLSVSLVVACSRTGGDPPLSEDGLPVTVMVTPQGLAAASQPTATPQTGAGYPAPASATTSPATDPYPAPATTVPASPYPGQTRQTATPTTPASGFTPVSRLYLPAIQNPAPTPTSTPSPTNTPPPTPTPTIDFAAVRASLQAEGQDLGFVKLGFHVGPGGNQTGIGDWMRRLDAAGVPFFLKSVDHAGPLTEAQEIVRQSDVPHTLVYRTTGDGWDAPDYNLPPAEAARQHWEKHKAAFPPELDPSLVWIETLNEVDKNRSEWLAEFALVTANLAMQDGYRWAAFGWSSGEPEPSDWESPSMLAFLRLAAENPDRLAIALHEYSFLARDIGHEYPHKVGRFQDLFAVVDRHGIPRPTVLITEWGWEYDNVPDPTRAMEDIAWASRLYAPYPQVKGAAIWYLGPGFDGIADQVQRLIRPVTEYALGNYFAIPLPPQQAPLTPEQYPPPAPQS